MCRLEGGLRCVGAGPPPQHKKTLTRLLCLQLEMEDEDTIDVFQQQTGGSRVASCLSGSDL